MLIPIIFVYCLIIVKARPVQFVKHPAFIFIPSLNAFLLKIIHRVKDSGNSMKI
jgi:hypothetical protein